jgi:hypothetical protein
MAMYRSSLQRNLFNRFGAISVGNTRDLVGVMSFFSQQILTHLVQYSAGLPYGGSTVHVAAFA